MLRRRSIPILLIVLFLSLVLPISVFTQTTVNVPGTADIFLSGLPFGTCIISPFYGPPVEDCIPGQSAVFAENVVPGTALQFVVTGSTNNSPDPATASSTPDGGNSLGVQLFGPAGSGLSGITTVFNTLVGVFLSTVPPSSTLQPPNSSFIPPGETSFQVFSPQLQQIFFIGDGLTETGTGTRQSFIVPQGATSLFLGSSDGVGTNQNNKGSLSVQILSSCDIPQPASSFYQGAAPPFAPPDNVNAAQIAYPATPTTPVPQRFGLLPDPNLAPYVPLCPTIKSGCALSVAATMLTTFPNVTEYPTKLDGKIKAADDYDDGKIFLCPVDKPSCSPKQLCTKDNQACMKYNDECEMDWFAPEYAEPATVSWIDGQEVANNRLIDIFQSDRLVSVPEYLADFVCGHTARVVLELNEFVNGSIKPSGSHYVYVTSQNGATDWNVFDPGWKNVTVGTSSTLNGHLNGFRANGSWRRFTVAGVRSYEDIQNKRSQGAFAVIANSPVELLVVDPQGRRLGNSNGSDVFQIPLGSYVRDFPQADPLGTDTANGDPTGIKTAHVSSPLEGTYHVIATGIGLGTYILKFHSLTSDGSIQSSSVIGVTNTGSTSIYQVSVSPSSGFTGTPSVQATFHSTLADIANSFQLGLIDNAGIANALASMIQAAQAAAANDQNQTAVNILNAFENQLSVQTGQHITGVATHVLKADASSLIAQQK